MKPPSRCLEEARILIADKANWCTGHNVNEDGQHCGLGALDRVLSHPTFRAFPAVEYLRRGCDAVYGTRSIVEVNDLGGHGAIIAAYDVAISMARTDEEQGVPPPPVWGLDGG